MIVFIIGTTASGKTKLSLNLEHTPTSYQILSSDSMQLYKNASIMTAKATPQEQARVKHHGIDELELNQEGFNRKEWQAMALNHVQNIHSQKQIPVVVGGTHYYMETLLFDLDNQQNDQNDEQEDNPNNEEIEKLKQQIQENQHLTPYEQLLLIDPFSAQKFHQNDHRRILNQIQYFFQKGRLPSTITDFHSENNKLRSDDNFLIFWPKWKSKEKLKEKVTSRIKQMLHEEGGVDEILKVFDQVDSNVKGGVLQSIGYRQFKKMYEYYKQYQIKDDQFYELLSQGEQDLINDTMKYTKKQQQWIKNRIIMNHNIEIIRQRLFLLEFQDNFEQEVIVPAQQIYKIFKEGKILEIGDQFKAYQLKEDKVNAYKNLTLKKKRENWKKEECTICNKICNGPIEWEQHLKSKKHRINEKNKKKEQKQQ